MLNRTGREFGFVVALSVTLLALTTVGHARSQAAESLDRLLTPLLESHPGRASVAVKHLGTGESFQFDAQRVMPTASLIKVAVMVEAYRQSAEGKVDLDKKIVLHDEDKVPGSGILTSHFSDGATLSLRDAIRLMIAFSDNTATNLVLDQIGMRSVADTMKQLGWPNTRIHSKVYRRDTSWLPEASEKYGLGSTTAAEMAELLEQLRLGKLASAPATEEMLEHLRRCDDRLKFRRYLPKDARLAHKTGSVTSVRCDAGILETPTGPVVLCVLTAENEDRRWSDDNEGDLLCARVARIVYDHFTKGAGSLADANVVLRVGASGRLVEDLQRTLNARMNPSPCLAIDGEFGPATRRAVQRFQQEHHLVADGIVNRETWKALGDLITSDPPVPPPEVVNREKLPRKPADPLDGPPFVSCKAWAIADGKTGEFLWGSNSDQQLPNASTTKLMTAYIVFRLAAEQPAVLEERVTFSERADRTEGSTAGIRAGETLSVRELLFGLLLPSGNDAATAFAEHFGSRFDASSDRPDEQDSYARFVAEMNRTADSLGMKNTQFKNPHGLTAEGHFSSARDLVTLAHAAYQLPRFAEYVNTRRHGCRLVGPGGYQRNVIWNNTNRLLAIEGYDGVKTGTTSAAGACLVSRSCRGERCLLLAVLGSSSSDGRYVDSRNLFRWAWQQPAKNGKP